MTDKIEVDYDKIDPIIQQFRKRAEDYLLVYQLLWQMAYDRPNYWRGRGSDAFDAEMYDTVLPALKRPSQQLEQIAKVLRRVAVTLRQAEEEASRLFAPAGFLGGGAPSVGQHGRDVKGYRCR